MLNLPQMVDKPRVSRYVFYVLIVSALQVMILYYLLDKIFTVQNHHRLEYISTLYTNGIDLTQDKMDSKANDTFSMIVNNEHISLLMYEAHHAKDSASQDKIRQKLTKSLEKEYSILQTQGLRQLHFHLPGSISFLRFHSPEKYGDSLLGIRKTIDKVNETKLPVSGFEEGRVLNGFRHVFPLFYHDEFVGTVEVSYSFAKIKELLEDFYHIHTQLYLIKSKVDQTVFQDYRSAYKLSNLSNNYYIDTKANGYNQKKCPQSLVEKIEKSIALEACSKMGKLKDFTIPVNVDGKDILVVFHELRNFDGTHGGYITVFSADLEKGTQQAFFKELFMIGSFFAILFTIIIFMLIFALRQKESLYFDNAHTDRLTKIANRHMLNESLEYLLSQSARHNLPFSVIFFDIDHFKRVNDHFGHKAGDEVLMHLCCTIETRLRESDVFGRWGGEEFLILMSNTTLSQASLAAESFRKMIAETSFPHTPITCSFGVAQFNGNESYSKLISRADSKLYEAKHLGRNRVVS